MIYAWYKNVEFLFGRLFCRRYNIQFVIWFCFISGNKTHST